MKNKIVLIVLSTILLHFNEIYSQEPCKVLKQELAGSYVGKCKKGLAHGKGVAKGVDKYEGSFRNGLPHGKGVYTWATGEVYDGKWMNGKKDGQGKFFYKKNGVDSIRLGLWKDDSFYMKISPPQYKITKKVSVSRYVVHRIGDGDRVLFSIILTGMTNTSVESLMFDSSCGTPLKLGSKEGFENIVFPFRCRISYTTSNSLRTNRYEVVFEIEIEESGDWEIILTNT